MPQINRCLAVVMCAALASCGREAPKEEQRPSAPDPPWFEEISQRAGIDFVHRSGHGERFFLPEIMGGGVALFDMDGDGDLDLYLVQSGNLFDQSASEGHQLFRNRGNGTFENATRDSGADVRGYGMGVAAGDFDNDGAVDLYVTNLGPNVLLKNDGHGRFTDVTGKAGVAGSGWHSSAAFLDYDGDGWLDLFVVRYLDWRPSAEVECFSLTGVPDYCSPRTYDLPTSSVLYHNNRDGTFTDVSDRAGFRRAVGNGLGVVSGDFNGDGRIDIFVANDGTPNHLWVNQGSGRFHEDGLLAGCAVDDDGRAKAGMGVHAVDVDDDGWLDLLVVNLDAESDSFYRNRGKFFSDETAAVGLRTVSRPFTRFGMALLDFDNDGYLDLYEANGRVGRQSEMFSDDPYAEPNLLFRGAAGPHFDEVRPRGGTLAPLVGTSRGAAFGDVDNDGAIDIVVANRDGGPYLLHNVVGARGHWVTFRVLEAHGRDAFGAELTMTVGSRSIRRDVRAAYSYLASNDPRVHVGLGQEAGVRGLMVRWPDGAQERFGDFAAGKIVVLRRGGGIH
jgi:enediyne biosynthesis protein E4